MVHVSDAGGRHKMLAFTTSAEPTFTGIDSIIKVNTKEVVTFNDHHLNPSSSNHHHHSQNEHSPTSEFHSGIIGTIGIPPQSIKSSSPIVPKTILKNTLNSFDKSPKYRLSDKMFADEEQHGNNNANNGNANYFSDTINSNSNTTSGTTTQSQAQNNMMRGNNMNYGHHDLDLISHGLTDSVCETIKLLENDYDHKCGVGGGGVTTATSASLSSGISGSSSSTSAGGIIDEPNVVYTEEIVISTARSAAMTGMTKPGIMKTFSSFSSSSSSSTNAPGGGGHQIMSKRTEQWKTQQLDEEDEEAMSQSNESEETPLLTAAESSSDTQPTIMPPSSASHVSTAPNATSDNISNDSLGMTTAASAGAGAPPVLHKLGKMTNGTKAAGLKRVSFGSSKGSMVETLIYESPVSDAPGKSGRAGTLPILSNGSSKSGSKGDVHDSPDSIASGGSTGGSRPPSRVRVTFFESEKPLAVSSPESDIIDFDLSKMTIHGSPTAVDHSSPTYNRQIRGSTGGSRPPSRVRVTFFESEKPLAVSSPESDIIDFDLSKMTIHGSPTAVDHSSPTYNRQISVEGWDNPFRPDGDLSKEADQIVELIKEGKPINDETLRSKSPSVNETMNTSTSIPTQNQLNASPKGKEVNGSATNGTSGPVDIQHTVVAPAAQAGQVEHVVLKKKKGCCVIQ